METVERHRGRKTTLPGAPFFFRNPVFLIRAGILLLRKREIFIRKMIFLSKEMKILSRKTKIFFKKINFFFKKMIFLLMEEIFLLKKMKIFIKKMIFFEVKMAGFSDFCPFWQKMAKNGLFVASGILPDVEGGFQPPGLGPEISRVPQISAPLPPRWKRGSTADRDVCRHPAAVAVHLDARAQRFIFGA